MIRSSLEPREPVRWTAVAAAALVAASLLGACSAPSPAPPVKPGGPTVAPPRQALPSGGEESDARRRARIRLELAASYYEQGNYNVALEEVRQSVAIDPEYAPAHGMLGLVYMDLGKRAEAEESFQRALRITPDDSELNNNYGWFLCQTGREKQSIEYFQRALRNPLYNTPARPMHNAGICSMRMGDEAAAEGWFQRSFQVDPRNPVAMYNLAELYLKRRDLERARFHSQRLVASYEPTAQVLWLALRVERASGNRDAEASLGAQLRRRFPASPEAALLAAGRYGD
ncbi:MAG TPA: type IV pilus biogenesis/stability protein PilW [Quisquiliibacterium sp.]|nr:type IV pilus biogenesis/stability protein PilW [Quisquiliibacterium sp.]